MKRLFAIVAALAVVLSVSASAYAGKVTMRVGDIENVKNLGAIALDRFAKEIKETSDGKIKVKAFHASQMGSANKQLQLVKSGTLQAFRGSISWLAQFDTAFSLLDFPFTLDSAAAAKLVAESPALEKLNDKLAKDHGIRYVTAGWTRLPRQILVSKPVASVEDLKSVKLRVPEAYSYIESFKAVGAAPTPVAFSETYLALKQGIVDGAENHVESLYNMKWYEVAKHLVVTDHSYDITAFIVNDKWWQGLSADQQKMIVDTWNDVDEWYVTENASLQKKYIDLMVKEGGVQIHNVDKNAFISRVVPDAMNRAEEHGEWEKGLWNEIEEMLKK
ncbi:MAG: TRAP transporter substrate-binding protein [Desulfobacterales bacterium]|nr:TRAP transporter substrate-binding protein [Desulfobacterales bacterium]